MGKLSTRVRRLQDDLAAQILAGTQSQPEIDVLRNRSGRLLLEALNDVSHPLAIKLTELHASVALTRVAKSPPGADSSSVASQNADRLYFMCQPGCGDRFLRSLWKLQLLLVVAATSSEASRLADRLAIDPLLLSKAVADASTASFGLWSQPQFAQCLLEAIAELNHPDPELDFSLEGTMLHHRDGTKVRLGRQQASFLRLLIQNLDHTVTMGQFRKAGINNPAPLKSRLVKKLAVQNIRLQLDSPVGGYCMRSNLP